jgi:hypothetical protein
MGTSTPISTMGASQNTQRKVRATTAGSKGLAGRSLKKAMEEFNHSRYLLGL